MVLAFCSESYWAKYHHNIAWFIIYRAVCLFKITFPLINTKMATCINRKKQLGILSEFKVSSVFFKPLDDELDKW